MRTVEIVLTKAESEDTRVWGEVKAIDEVGTPTIAHAEARLTHSDRFEAGAGRHVFQFRVLPRQKITLVAVADGAPTGPPTEFDCTTINAGRRFVFEVPA